MTQQTPSSPQQQILSYANKDHLPEGEHQRRGLERSFPSEYLNAFSIVTAGDPRNQQRYEGFTNLKVGMHSSIVNGLKKMRKHFQRGKSTTDQNSQEASPPSEGLYGCEHRCFKVQWGKNLKSIILHVKKLWQNQVGNKQPKWASQSGIK